jgi:hypothetical protein
MPEKIVSRESDHSESQNGDAQVKFAGSNLGKISCVLGAIGLSIVGYTWFATLRQPSEGLQIGCMICFPIQFSVLGLIVGWLGFHDDEKRKPAVVGIILNLLLNLYIVAFIILIFAALSND